MQLTFSKFQKISKRSRNITSVKENLSVETLSGQLNCKCTFIIARIKCPDTCYNRMNLENVTLSGRSQSQKGKHCMIPPIENMQKRQIRRSRVHLRLPRAGGRDMELTG